MAHQCHDRRGGPDGFFADVGRGTGEGEDGARKLGVWQKNIQGDGRSVV